MKREHDFRYCVSLVQEPTRNRSSTPEDTDGFQTAARVDDPGIRGIPVFCGTTIVGTVHKREPGQRGIYRAIAQRASCPNACGHTKAAPAVVSVGNRKSYSEAAATGENQAPAAQSDELYEIVRYCVRHTETGRR